MRATKTILFLVMGTGAMEEKAGAASYQVLSDDELIARAIENLRKVFSPRLLYRFSVMVLNRKCLGFGEIRLLWARGELDTIHDTDSFKPNQLESAEDTIYNQGN